MVGSILGWTARQAASGARTLIVGTASSRLAVLGCLVVLVVVAGSAFGPAVGQLGGTVLLFGALTAVFSLVMRGR